VVSAGVGIARNPPRRRGFVLWRDRNGDSRSIHRAMRASGHTSAAGLSGNSTRTNAIIISTCLDGAGMSVIALDFRRFSDLPSH